MKTVRVARNNEPDARFSLATTAIVPTRRPPAASGWGRYDQQCWLRASRCSLTRTNFPVEFPAHSGAETASPAHLCSKHRTSLQ